MSISRYPDFEETIAVDTRAPAHQVSSTARTGPHTMPSRAADAVCDPDDLALDLDDDGNPWHPAPPATLVRPLALVLVLLAATLGLLFGPDVALWFALR